MQQTILRREEEAGLSSATTFGYNQGTQGEGRSLEYDPDRKKEAGGQRFGFKRFQFGGCVSFSESQLMNVHKFFFVDTSPNNSNKNDYNE